LKTKFISLIVSVAVILGLGLMMVPAVPNALAVTNDWGFEIQPSALKVSLNQNFTVNATVTWFEGEMCGWSMHLNFDPTLVNCTGITIPATLPNPPDNSAPDRAPGMPVINNTVGYVEDGYSLPPPGDSIPVTPVTQTFVFATITFKSKSNEGTCNLTFSPTGVKTGTGVYDTNGDNYLNWARVVNGTVKVGQANLTIAVGQDLVFKHTTANYSCLIPGMYANNVTEYRRATSGTTGRSDFCPWANRIALGAVPVKVQGADLVVDGTGDLVSQTAYLLAWLGGPTFVPGVVVRTYAYVGTHGAPYSVGENWSYNLTMYIPPPMNMTLTTTYWATVTAYEMVPLNAGCGVPAGLPCYKIVHRDAPGGGGNITQENWFADPAYAPGLGFVKMIDYTTYAAPDTMVLSGITGPAGSITILTAPNAGTPSLPNTSKWDWNTNVTLQANAAPGWTFSHWNSWVPSTLPYGLPVNGFCSQSSPGTLMVSDDTYVWAYFCELPPVLTYLGPANLTFTCKTGGLNPADQILEIMNGGGGKLAWSVADDVAWLSETPPSGNLNASVHQNINVSVDNSGLTAGTYYGNVTISGSPAVVVPVTLIVTPATSIDVMRNLPGNALDLNQTYPGMTFDVYVNFTAPVNFFNSIGLTDVAPAGWTVQVNKTWCSPVANEVRVSGNKVEVAWYNSTGTGQNFSAMYKVTVPVTATPGINEFPNCNISKAWCEYYFGAEGPYGSCVKGEYQIMITVPGKVVGETRDVNANSLSDTKVVLERGVAYVDSDESTPNYTITCWNTGNDYWLRGIKDRYFTLDTNVIGGHAGHNVNYPQYIDFSTAALLVGGYTLDLEGDYGLVPTGCSMSYAMRSVNLWLFWPTANNEWGLSVWKAMESVNSWQLPS